MWYFICETSQANNDIRPTHTVIVAWNRYRHILSRFWPQSVKLLQFFTGSLCMPLLRISLTVYVDIVEENA